jgi:two-component system chemotaxis response regulator CheY
MSSVLIVDDSAFMRSRIRRQLDRAGMEVVGEARDGKEGERLYCELSPDLVTMDVTMRGQDGLETTRRICDFDPDAKIVLFSIIDNDGLVDQARDAGALACVHKGRPQELVECLRKLSGESVTC